MAEFASRGVANAGLTTGIIGSALGVLNGGLGGILGTNNNGWICSENMPVSRYELSMQNELSAKDSKIALLEADKYTDQKLVEVYANLESRINRVTDMIHHNRDEQNCINTQQAVFNGQVASNLGCITNNLSVLNGLTKTVVPITNICPQPMPLYNSWTAPTTAATTTTAVATE